MKQWIKWEYQDPNHDGMFWVAREGIVSNVKEVIIQDDYSEYGWGALGVSHYMPIVKPEYPEVDNG